MVCRKLLGEEEIMYISINTEDNIIKLIQHMLSDNRIRSQIPLDDINLSLEILDDLVKQKELRKVSNKKSYELIKQHRTIDPSYARPKRNK